jgi:hypothetical protein
MFFVQAGVGEDNFGSLNKGGIRLLVELEQEMAGFSPSFFMGHFGGITQE